MSWKVKRLLSETDCCPFSFRSKQRNIISHCSYKLEFFSIKKNTAQFEATRHEKINKNSLGSPKPLVKYCLMQVFNIIIDTTLKIKVERKHTGDIIVN